MARELVIVKIGGSIITGREKETINFQGLSRIADELRDACKSKQLIVVHGGGSFTHHLSADYRLYEGAKDERDRINAAIIQGNMMRLNLIFVKSLHERGVPAISVVPSTSTITREGRILKFDLEPMRLALSSGFVPVANGDISLDYSKVVSDSPTEGLVGYLAMQLAPEKVIIATDVDGTFTTNPKKDSCAKLISTVDERNIAQVIEAVKP
ncbi:MAG: hypothetical protein KGH61_04390, partial [Candidatus Micrarchaeota archaeon]|nr:hypothetical protein [Candidatus Micrarchaeota archaeon]